MASLRSRIFRLLTTRKYDWSKPLPQLRRSFERDARLLRVARHVKISHAQADSVSGEWIRPRGASEEKVMLYLHGGGYVSGSSKTHRPLASRIAKACKLNTLFIEYRLAPEHPFPAALEDSMASYLWLLKQGFQPGNIVIAGDSAGGGLVLSTLVALRDAKQPLPSAAVCLSPWTDLAGTGESINTKAGKDPFLDITLLDCGRRNYVVANDPRTPLISPLYANLKGLPPILIHVGTDEILLSDSIRLAENARKAGVNVTLKIWPDMWHVFHFWATLIPEADMALKEIGEFVNEAF